MSVCLNPINVFQQPYFFEDVTSNILSRLNLKSLVAFNEVCKPSSKFIHYNSFVVKFMIEKVINSIDDSLNKIQLLLLVAIAEKQEDFSAIKEAAKKITDTEEKSKAFLEILKEEIKINSKEAEKTVDSIASDLIKFEALLLIAIAQGQNDFSLPKKAIYKIADPEEKSKAFLKIFKEEIKFNLNEAKQTFNCITTDWEKFECILLIAVTEKNGDFSEVKEAASKMMSAFEKSKAFLEIFKEEVKINVNNAEATLNCIRDDLKKYEALFLMVKEVAKSNSKKAEEIALSACINYPFLQSRLFLKIAKKRIKYDLEGTREIIDKYITNDEDKSEAFLLLALAEEKKNFCEAKNAAQKIIAPHHKFPMLLKIVKAQVKHDIAGAKETTKMILQGNYQSLALLEIVKEEVKYDLLAAKETANSIVDKRSQALAFLAIAIAEKKGNFFAAKRSAHSIVNEETRSQVVLEIVKEEVKFSPQSAKDTFKLIKGVNVKIHCLLVILEMEKSKRGFFEEFFKQEINSHNGQDKKRNKRNT